MGPLTVRVETPPAKRVRGSSQRDPPRRPRKEKTLNCRDPRLAGAAAARCPSPQARENLDFNGYGFRFYDPTIPRAAEASAEQPARLVREMNFFYGERQALKNVSSFDRRAARSSASGDPRRAENDCSSVCSRPGANAQGGEVRTLGRDLLREKAGDPAPAWAWCSSILSVDEKRPARENLSIMDTFTGCAG